MTKFSDAAIRIKIDNCPKLASLRSINKTLSGLVNADSNPTAEIAEVIRRDPTLTTRLLRLVNSVFFGLAQNVTNVEEGIIYLGTRQIKELALATPVIEDFDRMSNIGGVEVNWAAFWQHSIGTAMVTRELLEITSFGQMDESDYIAGLVHNVGKLVMASAFSRHFVETLSAQVRTNEEVCALEREILGWDHAKVGAYYLRKHKLPEHVVVAVEYHNNPGDAPRFSEMCAAVQLADHMVRTYGVNGLEDTEPVEEDGWRGLEGWDILFGEELDSVQYGIAGLKHTLKRLPEILQGMTEEVSENAP